MNGGQIIYYQKQLQGHCQTALNDLVDVQICHPRFFGANRGIPDFVCGKL